MERSSELEIPKNSSLLKLPGQILVFCVSIREMSNNVCSCICHNIFWLNKYEREISPKKPCIHCCENKFMRDYCQYLERYCLHPLHIQQSHIYAYHINNLVRYTCNHQTHIFQTSVNLPARTDMHYLYLPSKYISMHTNELNRYKYSL